MYLILYSEGFFKTALNLFVVRLVFGNGIEVEWEFIVFIDCGKLFDWFLIDVDNWIPAYHVGYNIIFSLEYIETQNWIPLIKGATDERVQIWNSQNLDSYDQSGNER